MPKDEFAELRETKSIKDYKLVKKRLIMNFKQIAEQYPKAWEKCLEWQKNSPNDTGYWTMGGTVKEFYPYPDTARTFYDFFDSEGIYIGVTGNFRKRRNDDWEQTMISEWFKEDGFVVDIFMDRKRKDGFIKFYNTRTEAETEAFTKAFEILNNQLNQ